MKLKLMPAALLGLALVVLSYSGARAGYFVNSFASSPLATYLFGNVNQATASAAASSTVYTNGTSSYSANGSAAADLSTGALHAEAQALYGYPGACPNCDSPFIFGNANFGDSLTFLGSFTGQTVTFQASVSGTWTTNCLGCVGQGADIFQLLAMPGGTIDQYSGNEFGLFDPSSPFYDPTYINPTTTSTSPVPFNTTVYATVTLNGLNPVIDIAASLDITGKAFNVGDAFDGNFADTANISFTAPPGVTVLSASGVFPDTIPAPEPATITILGMGLLGFAAIRRRRRAVGSQQIWLSPKGPL